jgi:hypothetical protein
MLRQEKTRLIVSSVLIIICLAFIGYRTTQKINTPGEVCETKGLKEQQEVKVKSALPIFESLSRHLLTIQ